MNCAARGVIIGLAMASRAAIDFGTLCGELDALIAAPPTRDEAARAQLERTLTDGYASALSLEAERLRLERRIGQVAVQVSERNKDVKADELADLSLKLSRASGELRQLRERLVTLRRRASAAA
jgi:ABC-type phosphate transport system auxiliary subunit